MDLKGGLYIPAGLEVDEERMVGMEELVLPVLKDGTIVEDVDMMVEDEETDEEEIAVDDGDVDRLLEVERVVGIPVDSGLEVVGAGSVVDRIGSFVGWLPAATALMMLGSSLGRETSPLTVHPPEEPGQAGGLKVGL